jgi:hypothetical protein
MIWRSVFYLRLIDLFLTKTHTDEVSYSIVSDWHSGVLFPEMAKIIPTKRG